LFTISFWRDADSAVSSASLVRVNEETWTKLLQGEWMVEFHAPWCPACKDLQKAWNAFADWSKDLNIQVAEVDVTQNPGLSGRFLVTALPTIYHVKDGVFRVYTGPRDKNDFITFVEEKRWSMVDPVPSWKHPNSAQMGVVAVFFKLSMAVRDLHNHLVEEKGIPSWASYGLFAGVTLALGCVLGFFIVCIIDYVFPTGAFSKKVQPAANDKKQQQQKKKDQQKGGKKETTSKETTPSKEKEEEKRHSQDEHSQGSQGEESADESTVKNRKGAKPSNDKTNKSPAPPKKPVEDKKKK